MEIEENSLYEMLRSAWLAGKENPTKSAPFDNYANASNYARVVTSQVLEGLSRENKNMNPTPIKPISNKTLLDEIAIEAMNGFLVNTYQFDDAASLARDSYDIAKAMLKEKAEREG